MDMETQQGYEDEQEQQEDAALYSKLALVNKEIEPDKQLNSELMSRNLQLGNVDPKQFKFISDKIDFFDRLVNYPNDQGGWLYNGYGKQLFATIDKQIVLSNSRGGFLRKMTRSLFKSQNIKEEAAGGGMLGSFGMRK